nr:hypothetical protein [Tanacetum cinerariifolium]
MPNTNTNLPAQTSNVLHNDTVSSCSTSKFQENTQLSRSRCMNSIREVKSQFKFLSETLQDFGTMPIFKRTFFQDLDLLEQHLTKDILSHTDCKTILTKVKTTFENAFNSEFKERIQKYTRFNAQSFKDAMICNMDSIEKYVLEIILHQQRTPQLLKQKNQMTDKYFVEYTKIEVKHFRDTLLQHMGNVKKSVAERTRHQRQYDRRVNKRQMQTQESKIDTGKVVDADLVITESSGTESEVQDDNGRSRNDTDADDADIRPIYDEEPMTEEKRNSVDTKFAKTSVLGKPILQSLRNQSVVRQLNAFKSERPQMSKPWFASQVDVNNNLSRPVTQHYLPKKRESAFAKPDHMIESSSSRNSSKTMPRFSSNDMVHNYYLEEVMKKKQERNRNSKSCVMHTASPQNTTKGRKPIPRSNNQTSRSLPVSKSSCATITVVPKADHSKSSSSFSDSKHFVCSTCHKCVFSANHDACITKLLKEVNSCAKIQSYKTRNSNKLLDQKSHTQKPGRQIFTRQRFFPNKTSAVYEKTSSRSDLRRKPTGRIFKFVGLRWIPTGKLFDSCTSKVDSEHTHGSNVDILNIHESKQTLDLSAGTSINVQKEQSLDLSASTLCNVNKENLRV